MSAYILHPKAYIDLDDIWEFIAEDNLDAADCVREEIYETIKGLVPFPHQGHRRPDHPACTVLNGAQFSYRLCSRRKAVSHSSRYPRQPKPPKRAGSSGYVLTRVLAFSDSERRSGAPCCQGRVHRATTHYVNIPV